MIVHRREWNEKERGNEDETLAIDVQQGPDLTCCWRWRLCLLLGSHGAEIDSEKANYSCFANEAGRAQVKRGL